MRVRFSPPVSDVAHAASPMWPWLLTLVAGVLAYGRKRAVTVIMTAIEYQCKLFRSAGRFQWEWWRACLNAHLLVAFPSWVRLLAYLHTAGSPCTKAADPSPGRQSAGSSRICISRLPSGWSQLDLVSPGTCCLAA